MNKTFLLFGLMCVGAAAAVLVTLLVINPMQKRDGESLDGDPAVVKQRMEEQDAEIKHLREKVLHLEKENLGLRSTLDSNGHRGGMSPLAEGDDEPAAKKKGAEAAAAVPADGGGGESSTADGKKGKLPWKELADDIMEIMKLAKEHGDKPTPELMKKYSALMGRLAEIQGKLGYAEPGLVTSSPAFISNIIEGMLQKEGLGLSEAERASLDEITKRGQGVYHNAVKGPDTPYALEKTGRIVDAINTFEHDAFQVLGRDRFKGTELEGDMKDDGNARETPWPEHSVAGVKDLDEAAKELSQRWISRMSLPKSEASAITAIAREYASRSHDARSRVATGPKGTMTNKQRHALDKELVGYQLDALKRISSLNLDEDTQKKVRAYNSLDRVNVGGKGSWSRSGGFGNMQFSSSSEEEKD